MYQFQMIHVILNDRITTVGFPQALAPMADSATWLLWPGPQPLHGAEAIVAQLERQPGIDSSEVMLSPMRLVLAGDTSMALVYGSAYWHNPVSGRRQMGHYTMAWRRHGSGWKLAAMAVLNLIDPREVGAPDSLLRTSNLPTLIDSGPAAPVISADLALADKAKSSNAATAFGDWAAPGGVTFSSSGLLNRGPAEIAAPLERFNDSKWISHPVAAGMATDSTVGWTLGKGALATPSKDGHMTAQRFKYLTLWVRQPDGQYRFIASGSN